MTLDGLDKIGSPNLENTRLRLTCGCRAYSVFKIKENFTNGEERVFYSCPHK